MRLLVMTAALAVTMSCTSKPARRGLATISSTSAEISSISSELVVLRQNCSHLKIGDAYEVENDGASAGQIKVESLSGSTAIARIVRDRDIKKGAKVKAEVLPLEVCALGRGKFANVDACVSRITTVQNGAEQCENVEESEQWTHFFEDGRLIAELYRQSCQQRARWRSNADWVDVTPIDFCTRLKAIEASGKLTEERGSKT